MHGQDNVPAYQGGKGSREYARDVRHFSAVFGLVSYAKCISRLQASTPIIEQTGSGQVDVLAETAVQCRSPTAKTNLQLGTRTNSHVPPNIQFPLNAKCLKPSGKVPSPILPLDI